MSRKATHRGTCQICGRLQKLPFGLLSDHGYTKQFGFFMGTCPGAASKPFEISTDLIEAAISNARARAEQNLIAADELTQSTNPETWAMISIDYRRVRKPVRVIEGPTGRPCVANRETGELLEGAQRVVWGPPVETVAEAALALNRQEADRLRREAKDLLGYADWQAERLASWTPKPLTPIN